MWPTNSKDVANKKMLGPDGVGEILDLLHGTGVQSVAIGKPTFTYSRVWTIMD